MKALVVALVLCPFFAHAQQWAGPNQDAPKYETSPFHPSLVDPMGNFVGCSVGDLQDQSNCQSPHGYSVVFEAKPEYFHPNLILFVGDSKYDLRLHKWPSEPLQTKRHTEKPHAAPGRLLWKRDPSSGEYLSLAVPTITLSEDPSLLENQQAIIVKLKPTPCITEVINLKGELSSIPEFRHDLVAKSINLFKEGLERAAKDTAQCLPF